MQLESGVCTGVFCSLFSFFLVGWITSGGLGFLLLCFIFCSLCIFCVKKRRSSRDIYNPRSEEIRLHNMQRLAMIPMIHDTEDTDL